MNLELKAGQFHDPPAAGKEEGRTVIIRPLEGRNGFAFALCDAGGKHVADAARLTAILEEHVERLSSSFGKDAHAQHRFEQFLASLNETVALTVKNSEWTLPIASFAAVVGIAEGNQMFLSGNGQVAAMFLHRTPAQRYQVYNLSRSILTEQALPTWEKAFAVVLDGELHPGDVLCVANHDLQPVIETDELCSILSTLPPAGAAAKIRQYFAPKTSLSAFVIRIVQEGSTFETAKPTSERSLADLSETRDETTRLLEDQTPRPTNAVKSAFQALFQRKPKVAGSSRPAMPSLMRKFTRVSAFLAQGKVLLGRLSKGGRARDGVSDPETRAALVDGVRARADRAATKTLGSIKGLPHRSRYLLLAALGVIVAFGLSISFLSRSHATSEDGASYAAALDRIRDVREQAAAAVIYQDESRARTLYQEASTLANALPVDTEERGREAAAIKALIAQSLDELRRAVTIPDPPLVTDLSALGVSDARTLTVRDGLLYVLSADRHAFRIDPAAKNAEPLIVSAGEVGAPREAAIDNARILFLDDRPGLSRFDITGGALQLADLVPAPDKEWRDLVLYADKLYVLQTDGTDGQILRFPRSGSGWSAPTEWIRSKAVSLSNAKSFAIDATVFILTGDNLVRFSSGGQMGWKPGTVDPPLEKGVDVWTDTSSDWLYVLEPSKERLLVYEKETGSFANQYVSAAFADAKDMVIDEAAKTAYILAGTKLYAIRLSHLQ